MYIKIFFPLIVIFLSACGARKNENGTTGTESEPTVEKTFRVSGEIKYSESYCGGARPTDAMLEELARLKPYEGKELYVIKGTKNEENKTICDTIISDSEGKFELNLPAGEYCIIQSAQLDKKVFNYCDNKNDEIEADRKCLEAWWPTCFYSFSVNESPIDSIQLIFHRPCFLPEGIPCLNYTGPMPP